MFAGAPGHALQGVMDMMGVSLRLRSFAFAMLAGAGLVAGLVAAPAPAQAANWLEKSFLMSGANYDGVLPPCEAALGKISSRFETKESQFWNSSLQILGYERVRQIAYNPWARGTIPRRFCSAVALVSDGRKHRVDYWIGEDTGMIGAGWGVEWCVVGLDRNWAYNPGCKMARP
jgi:hypothetical protein